MKTMKAVCVYSNGGPEVLKYEDAPRPHYERRLCGGESGYGLDQ